MSSQQSQVVNVPHVMAALVGVNVSIRWRRLLFCLSLVVLAISSNQSFAHCPSADLTGDCFVNLEDFCEMANQWLTGDPCIPDDMAYIPGGGFAMGRHVGYGSSHELPLHAVLFDSFFIVVLSNVIFVV